MGDARLEARARLEDTAQYQRRNDDRVLDDDAQAVEQAVARHPRVAEVEVGAGGPLQPAGRRAAVVCDEIAVVALLARVDDAVAAEGEPAVPREHGHADGLGPEGALASDPEVADHGARPRRGVPP